MEVQGITQRASSVPSMHFTTELNSFLSKSQLSVQCWTTEITDVGHTEGFTVSMEGGPNAGHGYHVVSAVTPCRCQVLILHWYSLI